MPATEGVPVVVAMEDYLRRGVAARAPTTPEHAPPCARVTVPTRSQTRAGAPVVTDLDARYPRCATPCAHPDALGDLRAEIAFTPA